MLNPAVPVGAVPVKAPVVALNFNQLGNAAPVDCVAVRLSGAPWGSVNVPFGRVKLTAWPWVQVWPAVCAATTGAEARDKVKFSEACSP